MNEYKPMMAQSRRKAFDDPQWLFEVKWDGIRAIAYLGKDLSIRSRNQKELLTKSFSDYISATIKEAKEIITGPESILSEWKDFITVFRLMRHRMFVENPKLVDGLIKTYKISPFK